MSFVHLDGYYVQYILRNMSLEKKVLFAITIISTEG